MPVLPRRREPRATGVVPRNPRLPPAREHGDALSSERCEGLLSIIAALSSAGGEERQLTAPSHRRVLTASFVGTAIEFYDFYIYATAASLVFGELFFPKSDPGLAQMAAFATLAVAFFARPVGAAATYTFTIR